jgi:hypothetical protein
MGGNDTSEGILNLDINQEQAIELGRLLGRVLQTAIERKSELSNNAVSAPSEDTEAPKAVASETQTATPDESLTKGYTSVRDALNAWKNRTEHISLTGAVRFYAASFPSATTQTVEKVCEVQISKLESWSNHLGQQFWNAVSFETPVEAGTFLVDSVKMRAVLRKLDSLNPNACVCIEKSSDVGHVRIMSLHDEERMTVLVPKDIPKKFWHQTKLNVFEAVASIPKNLRGPAVAEFLAGRTQAPAELFWSGNDGDSWVDRTAFAQKYPKLFDCLVWPQAFETVQKENVVLHTLRIPERDLGLLFSANTLNYRLKCLTESFREPEA